MVREEKRQDWGMSWVDGSLGIGFVEQKLSDGNCNWGYVGRREKVEVILGL